MPQRSSLPTVPPSGKLQNVTNTIGQIRFHSQINTNTQTQQSFTVLLCPTNQSVQNVLFWPYSLI